MFQQHDVLLRSLHQFILFMSNGRRLIAYGDRLTVDNKCKMTNKQLVPRRRKLSISFKIRALPFRNYHCRHGQTFENGKHTPKKKSLQTQKKVYTKDQNVFISNGWVSILHRFEPLMARDKFSLLPNSFARFVGTRNGWRWAFGTRQHTPSFEQSQFEWRQGNNFSIEI